MIVYHCAYSPLPTPSNARGFWRDLASLVLVVPCAIQLGPELGESSIALRLVEAIATGIAYRVERPAKSIVCRGFRPGLAGCKSVGRVVVDSHKENDDSHDEDGDNGHLMRPPESHERTQPSPRLDREEGSTYRRTTRVWKKGPRRGVARWGFELASGDPPR